LNKRDVVQLYLDAHEKTSKPSEESVAAVEFRDFYWEVLAEKGHTAEYQKTKSGLHCVENSHVKYIAHATRAFFQKQIAVVTQLLQCFLLCRRQF
jgi:hypothetical protein